MEKNKIVCLLIILILSWWGCKNKIYPDEKFAFSTGIRGLFNALLIQDTFSFKNDKGDSKTLIISQADSITDNAKGLLMNGEPYKEVWIELKETGNKSSVLERPNKFVITKRPRNNLDVIGLNFYNLFYVDTALPQMIADSNLNNHARFNHFYVFESAFKAKHPWDATKVFMDSYRGFLGFETSSGELWVNEKVLNDNNQLKIE